jgi:hypothetical protein
VTARERRVVFWGAAVIGSVVSLRLVPDVVSWHTRLRERSVSSTVLLARNLSTLDQAPAIRDSLAKTLAAFVELAPPLVVEGSTRSEAQEELLRQLPVDAAVHGVRVTSIAADSAPASGPIGTVAVAVEAEGDITGLARWLARMEGSNPVLSVSALAISTAEANGTGSETLHARLSVSGRFLPRSSR